MTAKIANKQDKRIPISFSLNESEYINIAKLADELKVSRSMLIRMAVNRLEKSEYAALLKEAV